MLRTRTLAPITSVQSATASASMSHTTAASSSASAPAARALASSCGKYFGRTRYSRVSAMLSMARATAPMLPGWVVPTSTMRMRERFMGADSSGGAAVGPR
jgi:hypothetical protein